MLCASPLLLFVTLTAAEQYQSEVRELPGTPPPPGQQDAQKLLDATTDPYARALLLRDLAGQSISDKDYKAAARYLEQAISEGSLSEFATLQMKKDLAQLLIVSGEPEDIVRALEASVKDDPKAPAVQQAALGGAYLMLQRAEEALPLLQRAVATTKDPDESWLQGLYAAQVATGRKADAIAVLRRLLRINPQQRDYWVQLGGLLVEQGKEREALGVLELAARQGFLVSADERLQLIALTAELGAPFEAGSLMRTWMDEGSLPPTAENFEALAGFWVDARETGLAAQALAESVRLAPDGPRQLYLGQLHMQREEYALAAQWLDAGLQQGGRTGAALLMLGNAYFHSAELDAAISAFEQAAKRPDAAASATQWLEYLASPAAVEQARRLASRAPGPAMPVEVSLSNRLTGEPARIRTDLFSATDAAPDLRRIGGRLTPVGAERDANADGTIPEWDGGLVRARWPSAFKPGQRLADPWPDDRPQFVITGRNAARYATLLSASHRALLATYPSYQMPVYPTRRSVAYPQAIYDATQGNIGKAKLIGSDALSGARLGFPFPHPENGVEAMWNHRARYRGDSVLGISSTAVVGEDGPGPIRRATYRVMFRYANVEDPVDLKEDNILLYGITYLGKPKDRRPEFVILFHETANSIEKSRGIWALLGRVGRMFRIPPVGYDQPLFGTDGLAFIDMIDMYNGAFDRYVWKLVGKREMIIPYNSFRLNDGRYSDLDLLQVPHFNQEGTRYERHRVWVIEAVERGGERHAFGKRIFYIDEDTWNVVLVENYDRQGRPWRFQEGHLLPFYDNQSANTFPIVTYDLKDGRYYAERMLGETPPVDFNAALEEREFLPAAVKRTYSR